MHIDKAIQLAYEHYQAGNLQQAEEICREILKVQTDNAQVYNNLGIILDKKGQIDEAITCYRSALQFDPTLFDVYFNLGNALKEKNQLDEAIHCYRRALELDPENARAHWNISLYYLLTGNFTEGWKEYEWRWKLGELEYHARQDFPL